MEGVASCAACRSQVRQGESRELPFRFSDVEVISGLEENSFGEVVSGAIGRRGTGNGDCKPLLKAFFCRKKEQRNRWVLVRRVWFTFIYYIF